MTNIGKQQFQVPTLIMSHRSTWGIISSPHSICSKDMAAKKIVHDPAELGTQEPDHSYTKNYDIAIQRIAATIGPTVTLYEIVPCPGVRISRIKTWKTTLRWVWLRLASASSRNTGRGTIGIEVPNVRKTVVSMKTLLSSDKFQNNNFALPIAIGKRIDNENFIVDLASMPHLLMAGATGQGKSVGVNALFISLLYKNTHRN